MKFDRITINPNRMNGLMPFTLVKLALPLPKMQR
jgi:hypothetical protein